MPLARRLAAKVGSILGREFPVCELDINMHRDDLALRNSLPKVEPSQKRTRDWQGIAGVDYVKEVTRRKAFTWDPRDEFSRGWRIERSTDGQMEYRSDLPSADIPIVAYDFGIKYNILRKLRQRGSELQAARSLSFQWTGRS